MNYSLNSVVDCVVRAKDGDVGTVDQFYFDDLTWTIRYMTLKTEKNLPGRIVLIPLAGLGKPDLDKREIPVNLTIAQVLGSPTIEIGTPLSREHEIELHRHYAWPGYWGESYYAPPGFATDTVTATYAEAAPDSPSAKIRKIDPHLRSIREVTGCQIQASNGNIGNIEDFLVDDETWCIRYLVANTRIWLPDRFILISPHWIKGAVWVDRKIIVDLTREAVKKSPKYDPAQPVSPAYEDELRDHLKMQENTEWILFKFHAPPKSKVFVAGTFNNWDPSAIKLRYHGKGIYTAMILLPLGTYEYKFIVNGEWENGPDCRDLAPNAFGTTNSQLVVSHTFARDVHLHTFMRRPAGESHRMWSAAIGG